MSTSSGRLRWPLAGRLRPLSGDVVEELPEPCRSCLFWELGRSRPDPRRSSGPDGAVTRKEAWCTSRALEGAPPGRVVWVDDAPGGYALFGPAEAFTGRLAPVGVPAASGDALLLATLWVEPYLREQGIGRLLLQAAVRQAISLELKAVESYGDRRFRERQCLLPATWLLHEGFEVHREHPRYPLLRLDVRRTVRWAESLEHAVEELLGHVAVPPLVDPAPASSRGVSPPGPPGPACGAPRSAAPRAGS